MTHRIPRAALLTAVALLAPAAAAHAQTSLDTTYYFSCAGPQPAAKVQNLVASLQPAMWSTTKPATSFQGGAGCGFHDTPAAGGQRPSTTPEAFYDAYYKGVHDKAVEKVKVELHNLVTSRVRQGTTQRLEVRISEGTGTTATTLASKDFTVTPVPSSTGTSERFDVEFTGLKIKAGSNRVLTVTVHSLEATSQAWVHGASEVPAGVTFTEPAPLPAP